MSYETIGLICLAVPVVYEILAGLSHHLTVLPRMPSYSQMAWKRTDHWTPWKRWVVAAAATAIFVVVVGHLLWSWIR